MFFYKFSQLQTPKSDIPATLPGGVQLVTA